MEEAETDKSRQRGGGWGAGGLTTVVMSIDSMFMLLKITTVASMAE